jgi:hypothetical protein
VRAFHLALLVVLAGCAGGPPPPDWQLNSVGAMQRFRQHYLNGDTRLADDEFALAKAELARTGRGDLLARAELVRCAVRVASLDFDECSGFEALRGEAGAEELAYAEFLAGRKERPGAAGTDDPVSRLVATGVKLRQARVTPSEVAASVDIASAQGWRRPLLAWLGVQAKLAEAAGDAEALRAIRRRIELSTTPAK